MLTQTTDVVVVGAGHAGCEAALASARLGKKTTVLATNLDTVAFLACNPSIGGTAKGQIVKEIDALGGQMGINADEALIQLRMLNRGKGPAVYSPRAQVDKQRYHECMKRTLERTPNLQLRQGEAVRVRQTADGFSVETAQGLEYLCKAVIFATGVYLDSRIIIGRYTKHCGPNGFLSADGLTQSLKDLGFEIRRFKTGTPARVNARSIHFDRLTLQPGEEMPPFSYLHEKVNYNAADCYLTYTCEETHRIILDHLDEAPMFTGEITGIGPRYCPSIETKIYRFRDKERHQLFLEPEGLQTDEIYVQGASTSMPADVQEQIYRSIPGLEDVEIMRDAYAIEYDCINPMQLYPSLMYKKTEGIFCAGQINGTSGYEEAAAQGLIAGINAARWLDGKELYVPTRDTSYIGVLIDDITTKGTNEPYRMMTGRAEYRLYLRQDNADLRLTPIGREIGLVSDERYQRFLQKQQERARLESSLNEGKTAAEFAELFREKGENTSKNKLTYREMLKRSNISFADLTKAFGVFGEYSAQVKEQTEIDIKYEGYLQKQQLQIDQARRTEEKRLPADLDYLNMDGLRLEARQKLDEVRPLTLGQASRISGVSPSDINVLIVYLALHAKPADGKER